MTAALARDQQGVSFELPPEAAWWRVRRNTGGRPSTVLGPDGEPLFVPIHADRVELAGHGCEGSIRLEAVDENRRPVGAPVAFVELGARDEVPRERDTASGHADLVRTSFEAMTRTMEAMQRAQVERERALAQKERALTDAQVAGQRMHVDLMIALIERLGGAKPQDPVALIKQQLQFQKALEGSRRNLGLLPSASEEVAASDEKPATWLDAIKPFAPIAATGLQEILVSTMAKDDPAKATEIRRNFSAFAEAMGAARRSFMGQVPEEIVGTPPVRNAAGDTDQERLPRSRTIRELLAQLDDDEAAVFDEYLDSLDAEQYSQVGDHVASMSTTAERVAWVRGVMRKAASATPAATAQAVGGQADLPPSLIPVFTQLSRDEVEAIMQLVGALDRATIEKLGAQLGAMPTDQAVAAVRRAIEEARRRSASVAHRAVVSAMRTDEAATECASTATDGAR